MHRRFSWDALNVANGTACGAKKCYFQGEREGEGWLVCWRRSPLIQQSNAWAFAEELRVDFGVDHLLRGAPFLASLSRERATSMNARMHKVLGERSLTAVSRPFSQPFLAAVSRRLLSPPLLATLPGQQATSMNAKINISLDRRKHPPYRLPKKDGAKQIYAPGPHPVQAVRSCLWPECMVMKCTDEYLIRRLGPKSLTTQATEDFVANAPNKTKLRLGLQRNFALVIAMVKAHPCLKRDFQVYLRNDGAVLNIDLDRCKRNTSGSVSHSDTETSRLENQTMTLTTEPLSDLRLTCRDNVN